MITSKQFKIAAIGAGTFGAFWAVNHLLKGGKAPLIIAPLLVIMAMVIANKQIKTPAL